MQNCFRTVLVRTLSIFTGALLALGMLVAQAAETPSTCGCTTPEDAGKDGARTQIGRGVVIHEQAAKAYEAGDLPGANKLVRDAIDYWERLTLGPNAIKFRRPAARATAFEQTLASYRLLQKLMVAGQQYDAALEVADYTRARRLKELLRAEASEGENRMTVPRMKSLARALSSTIVEYSIVGRENVMSGGDPAEEETDLFIWVVAPDGRTYFRRVDLTQLRPMSLKDIVVKARDDAIGTRGGGVPPSRRVRGNDTQLVIKPELALLYRLLILPIQDRLPTQPDARVIVVGHGPLLLVPFVALQDSAGEYLIKRYAIAMAPSMSTLESEVNKRAAIQDFEPKNALVVGNPKMPTVAVTPGQPPAKLPQLPGTEEEARTVARLLNTKPLIGEEATTTTVLDRMTRADAIHIATHGLLDFNPALDEFGMPHQPVPEKERGGVRIEPGVVIMNGANVRINGVPAAVYFARERTSVVDPVGALALTPSTNDRGLLTAKEISEHKINASLVVLSACNTGRGTITGDGIEGLASAFLSAGTSTVVVSLWSVADAPTASTMAAFYKGLKQHRDKASALRNAMLATLKDHPDPVDWAGFVLIGKPD